MDSRDVLIARIPRFIEYWNQVYNPNFHAQINTHRGRNDSSISIRKNSLDSRDESDILFICRLEKGK